MAFSTENARWFKSCKNRNLGKEKPVIGSDFFLGTPVSFQSLTGGYQLGL